MARKTVNDPEVQAIFDAMTNFMGNEYNSTAATTTMDGTGTGQSINCVAVDGGKWNYYEFSPGVKVSVSPPTASLGPGGTQQFAASAKNPDGTPVASPTFVWSTITGTSGTSPQGSIDANGLYTAPATIAFNASDSLKCALGGTQAYVTFMVSLHP